MKLLNRLSIKNKLIAVVLLVTTMTLSIGFSIVIFIDIRNFREDMINSTDMSARLIGWACISALAFDDKKGVQDILTKIELMPSIVNVHVLNEIGELFGTFEKEKGKFEQPGGINKGITRFYKGYLLVGQPIFFQNRHYGTIYLRASTDQLNNKIMKYLIAMIALMFGLVIVTYIFATRFQRLISRPILKLAELTQTVSSRADYSIRVTKESEDEIGILYDGFNNMLQQIHNRKIAQEKAEKELLNHRDQLEEQVKIRTTELAMAKEEAETANAAKSDFLARMSHEIRTPLNAVTGLTNIVLKSELRAEQRDYLNKVQLAGRNLLQVINDILDFSKVEAGRLDLEHHPFDLDELMEQLGDLFGDRISQKNLELIFDLDPSVPRRLKGDEARITQVLTNLLSNAIKFTDSGEIVVKVEQTNIAERQPNKAVYKFSVSDTGIGISTDLLPSLFDPFTQVDSYLTRKYEGSGLGLAICQRLVNLMDGSIWVESLPGKGSTFSFTVLLEVREESEDVSELPSNVVGLKTLVAVPLSQLANRRVLVVEDSELNQDVVVALLQEAGILVETADNGNIAVDIVTTSARGHYDAVLMDIQMPVMDGYEATKKIREYERQLEVTGEPQANKTPIIALTAHALKGEKERCLDAEMDDYLAKPIDERELHEVLLKWIS